MTLSTGSPWSTRTVSLTAEIDTRAAQPDSVNAHLEAGAAFSDE